MNKKVFLGKWCLEAMLLTLGFTSCDNKEVIDDFQTQKDERLQVSNEQFVDKTVIPTYHALANKAIQLQEALEDRKSVV